MAGAFAILAPLANSLAHGGDHADSRGKAPAPLASKRKGPAMLERLAAEHAARRWELAQRVGFLEASIKDALAALGRGDPAHIIASALRRALSEGADERMVG